MKRILLLASIFAALVFSACQSNYLLDSQNQLISAESEWVFTKEITLKNGDNSAFLRICSNYEDSLNNYLDGIELKFNVITPESNDLVSQVFNSDESDKKESDNSRYVIQEPSVVIEHLGCNLKQEVISYSITFAPSLLKARAPLPIAAHETYNKFMGIVTEDDGGMDLYVGYWFKLRWLSSWTQVALPTMMSRPGYGCYPCPFDTYKMRIQVYRDTDDTVYPTYTFYDVVRYYQRRGTNCLMGSYFEPNCYIGTAPSGTTAFIHNFKFYYTPISGNQCPLAGSHFDGVNCFVANIPDGTFPSIWNNKWFIEPYLESDLI